MNKKTTTDFTQCKNPEYQGVTALLGMNHDSALSVVQALQFAEDNKEEFLNRYPCKDCFERLKAIQNTMAEMIIKMEETTLAKGSEERVKN